MISVRHLCKHYRVHERAAGFRSALRSLVRRDYKTVAAVDDLSFDIRAGERVGFLGPNGAGKTTTLKILSGLLHPTSGIVNVGGFTPYGRQREFLQSIMLVAGQKQQLLWDLPPVETFELNRAIYDVPRGVYQEQLAELVSLLELSEIMRKPTRQLSLGERMKCELAAALVHRPKVLFLDEPTIGLDVTMQAAVRGFIKSYNERYGATIILTSHYMDDVAALTPRVIVINQGKLAHDGSLDALARSVRPDKRVTLRLGTPASDDVLTSLGGRLISNAPTNAVIQAEGAELSRVLQLALSQLNIVDLKVEEAPLEEVLSDLFHKSDSRLTDSEGSGFPLEGL